MTPPRIMVAMGISLVVVAAAGGVAAVSWSSAQKLVHPARDAVDATPADAGLPFQRIEFRASDGLPLVGWWIPAFGAPLGTVLFLHGYSDSKDQVLPLLPALHRAGYHVFAYDARAHGESGGDVTTVGLVEVRDVEGAIAAATAQDPAAAERLALIGYSMGGATAINAASGDPRVDAIVADSAFATLENIASNSITAFTDLPKVPFGPLSVVFAGWIVGSDVAQNAPVAAARHLSAPVLVIQGEADEIALPDEDGAALAAAAPAGSELWRVPGAAHVAAHALVPAEYEERVIAFLDAHLRA